MEAQHLLHIPVAAPRYYPPTSTQSIEFKLSQAQISSHYHSKENIPLQWQAKQQIQSYQIRRKNQYSPNKICNPSIALRNNDSLTFTASIQTINDEMSANDTIQSLASIKNQNQSIDQLLNNEGIEDEVQKKSKNHRKSKQLLKINHIQITGDSLPAIRCFQKKKVSVAETQKHSAQNNINSSFIDERNYDKICEHQRKSSENINETSRKNTLKSRNSIRKMQRPKISPVHTENISQHKKTRSKYYSMYENLIPNTNSLLLKGDKLTDRRKIDGTQNINCFGARPVCYSEHQRFKSVEYEGDNKDIKLKNKISNYLRAKVKNNNFGKFIQEIETVKPIKNPIDNNNLLLGIVAQKLNLTDRTQSQNTYSRLLGTKQKNIFKQKYKYCKNKVKI